VVRARLVRAQDLPRVREYFARRAPYMGAAALAGTDDLRALLTDDGESLAGGPRADGADLDALCRFEFGTRIPDDLLVRTDRATMGASVEARVPFLDHDLVALVNRLPGVARMVPGISKTAPRLLARRWGIPVQTIVHRKIGFQIPLAAWFRGPLRGFWDAVLRERAVPGIEYAEVRRLHDAHLSGRGSYEEILWRIAALESWHRRWVDGASGALDAPTPFATPMAAPHTPHRAPALART
jgi:asparagine synthase (glutamine-hydrolysing)